MNPHFFTTPFYFAFIWFRVQGSRGGFAAFFLEDAILVSQPSPRGEGFVSGIPLSSSNLRPFGAPPSIGRREHPREPLPLEGAAERSEAGLASFFAAKGRIGHWRQESARGNAYQAGDSRQHPSACFCK